MTQDQSLAWIRGDWKSDPYCITDEYGRVGIDVDGEWGFQCKDFSTAYSIQHGHQFLNGNAITLWTLDQDPYWAKVSDPQPGDVYVKDIVLDGVNYGDTGIVDEVTSTGVYAWAQNQVLDDLTLTHGHPPSRVFYKFNQIKGYLRPTYKKGATMPTENDVKDYFSVYLKTDPTPDQVTYYTTRIWQTLASDVADSLLRQATTVPVTLANPDPAVDPPVVVEPLPEPLPIPDEKPVHIDVPILPKNSEIKTSVAIIITILSVLAGLVLAVINHK